MQETNYTVVGNTLHFNTRTVPADPDYYKRIRALDELMQLNVRRDDEAESIIIISTDDDDDDDAIIIMDDDDDEEEKPFAFYRDQHKLTNTLPSDGSHVSQTQSAESGPEKALGTNDARVRRHDETEPVVVVDGNEDQHTPTPTHTSPSDGSHDDVGHTQSEPEKAPGNDARVRRDDEAESAVVDGNEGQHTSHTLPSEDSHVGHTQTQSGPEKAPGNHARVRRDDETGPEEVNDDVDKHTLTHTSPSEGSHVGHTQSGHGGNDARVRRDDETEPVVVDGNEDQHALTHTLPSEDSHVGHTQSGPEKAPGKDAWVRVRRKGRKGTPPVRFHDRPPCPFSGSVESSDTGIASESVDTGASSDFLRQAHATIFGSMRLPLEEPPGLPLEPPGQDGSASPVFYTLDEMMHFSQFSVQRDDDDTESEVEEDSQDTQHPPTHPQTLLSNGCCVGHTESGPEKVPLLPAAEKVPLLPAAEKVPLLPAAENDAQGARRRARKRKHFGSFESIVSDTGDGSDVSDEWDFHSLWEPSPRRRSPSPFSSDAELDEADVVLNVARPTTPNTLQFVCPESATQSREEQPTSSTLPSDGSEGAADPPKWYEMNWQPKDIPFTADPGPRNGAADLQSDQPVDFLELFINDELLQNIVVQTNLYAEQFLRTVKQGSVPYSRARAWKPVTLIELKNFLGLFFLTGIVRKPEMNMFWSTDEPLATPFFNKTMARNRFQNIWRFLHFSDNESIDATDRLCKVRPVLDYLLSKFREMFQPDKNISIDEGMLLWRGCLSFRVYNPQKPIKYGIKSYILCDSGTGYCFNIKPYCGKHATLGDTVVFLLDKLAGHGYRLYMDNFYNSVSMCTLLIGLKTHVCGTLRKNRGEPPAIKEAKKSDLGIGERIMRHNDTAMVLAWRDKPRIVRMVTTLHQNEMEEVQVQQKGHKDKVPKWKPACIVAYNKSMNGVDRLDQNLAYYPCVRRSAKWTKKFVFYLFEISLFNAFVIYKAKNPQSSIHFVSFIISVVKSWTSLRPAGSKEVSKCLLRANAYPAPLNNRTPTHDPQSRLNFSFAAHVLLKLPSTPKRKHPVRRCRVCARKGGRCETRLYCKSCRVPLHPGECYSLYHSKVKYAE